MTFMFPYSLMPLDTIELLVFFSSTVLAAALAGLHSFITNKGRMRLVIGAPLSPAEYEAVTSDLTGKEAKDKIEAMWRCLFSDSDTGTDLSNVGAQALGFLVLSGRAEIKFALRHQGMYHEKIGILEDREGNKLVFSGSANETVYGLTPEYNAESITVFKSWDEPVFLTYGEEFVGGFEALWEGRQKSTLTVGVHTELYQEIASRCSELTDATLTSLDDLYTSYQDKFLLDSAANTFPSVPARLGGHEFSIRDHQLEAIRAWDQNQFKGILQLSTGSGKTITSIYAAVKVFEQRKKRGWSTTLIVAVPYIELAEQWANVLALFNIHPHKVWGSSEKWVPRLSEAVSAHRLSNQPKLLAILAVNRSLSGPQFASVAKGLPLNEDVVYRG